MLKDSRSYEVQIIDAVRSVNRALGGTYGTSSAIYKNEFNQYEVQLIDAIKGIGRTLSGKGLSLAGGAGAADLSGYATVAQFQDLSRRVTTLENESFFRLVDGNVTLKEQYQNLWVPGWLAAGGIGSEGSGGVSYLRELSDVYHGENSVLRADGTSAVAGDSLVYNSTLGWVAAPVSGGGGDAGAIKKIAIGSSQVSPDSNGVASITTEVLNQVRWYVNENIIITRDLTTGTPIASIQLGGPNSQAVQLYAPSGGGGGVSGYIGMNAVQSTSQAQYLFGIPYINATASASSPSRIVWDSVNDAWHFYGNVYADGWVAAGGIGSSSGGGVTNLSQLDDVSLSSPSNNQFLYYDNGYWKNTALKTINNISIIGSGNISISGGGGGGISSVSLAPGTNNGTLKLTVDSSVTDNIAVKGLGALAYKSSLLASDIPDISGKYVTLDTTQNNISGAKTFTTKTNFTGGLAVPQTAYIDLGPVRIKFENNALHITKVDPNDNNNYGIYADGFVSAGGVDQNS